MPAGAASAVGPAPAGEAPAALDTVREHYNPLVLAIRSMPKPVIAAVNGIAAGAGAGLAFACDFRIAAQGASFLMAFARVGLAADTGVSWTLPRLAGAGRAAELLMLAEPVRADRALEFGLVNQVVEDAELLAAAGALAARLAAGPTAAYAGIKEQLNYAAGHGLAEALDKEAEVQSALGRTADHQAATLAFTRKEQPQFLGR
jgi:2-(1,2-epoxy-1,2-dihydrophenyl)acetyl-CoA isomerase